MTIYESQTISLHLCLNVIKISSVIRKSIVPSPSYHHKLKDTSGAIRRYVPVSAVMMPDWACTLATPKSATLTTWQRLKIPVNSPNQRQWFIIVMEYAIMLWKQHVQPWINYSFETTAEEWRVEQRLRGWGKPIGCRPHSRPWADLRPSDHDV